MLGEQKRAPKWILRVCAQEHAYKTPIMYFVLGSGPLRKHQEIPYEHD